MTYYVVIAGEFKDTDILCNVIERVDWARAWATNNDLILVRLDEDDWTVVDKFTSQLNSAFSKAKVPFHFMQYMSEESLYGEKDDEEEIVDDILDGLRRLEDQVNGKK